MYTFLISLEYRINILFCSVLLVTFTVYFVSTLKALKYRVVLNVLLITSCKVNII